MIKKFNENWGTFDDYLNANEPKQKPPSSRDEWKEYWKNISKMGGEMDTVAEYAMENGISYQDALQDLSIASPKTVPVEFEEGTQIVGLPSGQVLYMTIQQIKYFKGRNLISWKNTWKKPTSGGLTPIEIKGYCFEDKLLPNILDQMNLISWR